MRENLLRAVMAQFESQALTARANLEVYLNAAVGVGEHPDLVGEIAKLTASITEAEENVRTLEVLIGQTLVGEEQ